MKYIKNIKKIQGRSEINILTNSEARITMYFTDAQMARIEYQRIYTAGIYGGEWIKEISYKENIE